MVDKPYLKELIVVDPLDETKYLKIIVENGVAKLITSSGTSFVLDDLTFDAITANTLTASGLVKGGTFGIGTDVVYKKTDVVISSAELLLLNTTPKSLVPAPGAGKVNVLLNAIWFLDYNSTAYDGIAAGEDLTIKYTDGSGLVVATCETDPFLTSTADKYAISYPAVNPGIIVPNAALVAHMASGNIATGNSPLGVRVYYAVIDLSTLVSA